jgi:hypothetical protein
VGTTEEGGVTRLANDVGHILGSAFDGRAPILARAQAFAREGDLYALFLMTMHDFVKDRLLEVVHDVRNCIPSQTQVVVNIGDFGAAQAKELQAAGVRGDRSAWMGTSIRRNGEKRKGQPEWPNRTLDSQPKGGP